MPQDIGGSVRDILVLIFLFMLRIGVPILITLLIGIWLQKVLQEPVTEVKLKREEMKAELRCWDWSDLAESNQAQSAAARRPDIPCWLAVQVSGDGLTEACYTCPLFSKHSPAPMQG